MQIHPLFALVIFLWGCLGGYNLGTGEAGAVVSFGALVIALVLLVSKGIEVYKTWEVGRAHEKAPQAPKSDLEGGKVRSA